MTVNLLENVVLANVVVLCKQDGRVELNLGTGANAGTGRIAGSPYPAHPQPNPCMSAYRSAPDTLREATCDADADRSGAGRSLRIGGAFGSRSRSASVPYAGWQRTSRQQPVQVQRQTPWGSGMTRVSTRTDYRRTGNSSGG
jgi:hypothetical protein